MKKASILTSFILSLLFVFSFSYAQTNIAGVYPHNASGKETVYYGKAEVVVRKDNSLKITFPETEKEPLVFLPLEGTTGIFESCDKQEGDCFRLEVVEEALVIYDLDQFRRLRDTKILAKDKKLHKKLMKEKKISMSLAEEIAALRKGSKDQKEEEPEAVFFPMNPTSDFHAKNIGKIIFFSEKPTIGKEDPSKIKTKFKVGEPVWAIAYLPVALNTPGGKNLHLNYANRFGRHRQFASFGLYKMEEGLTDEERRVTKVCSSRAITDEELTNNYLIFQVVPTPTQNEMEEDGAAFMGQQISKLLGKYEHELKVTLVSEEARYMDIVSGNFFYDASAGTEELKKLNEDIEKAQLARKKLPTPVFRDADLEASMLQQVELFAHAKGWKNKWVKVIIASQWGLSKDAATGEIKGKYIEAYCVFKNEKECGYINFGFIKDYLGGGNYSSTIRQYTIDTREQVSCDKVE